jgi:hypothetical protein
MSVEFKTDEERLVAEQAVGLYRSVLQAMHTAPEGRGLDTMETVLLNQGRAHLRSILQQAMSTHPEVQKGGPAPGRAPAAKASRSDTTLPRV